MTNTPRTPEQIIADWRGHAQVLRARGHGHDGDLLEQCADEITASLRGWLAWLSEPDAKLKSGKSSDYFRDHFAEWQGLGLAELRGRTRYFRSVIVPQRAHPGAARLAGEKAVAS